MEYLPGGNVADYLVKYRPLDWNNMKFFTSQVLGGLGYAHAQNHIVHVVSAFVEQVATARKLMTQWFELEP